MLSFSINYKIQGPLLKFFKKNIIKILVAILSIISIETFAVFYFNGLGLAYNDARSHLDIGRRIVEGLKPGLAQLGSVWLPLPHLLMVPTVWSGFFWHTGLAGAIVSMLCYVATGSLIYLYLKTLNVGFLGRIIGVFTFAINLNILYLQSTAMTELLLIATSTSSAYYLLLWSRNARIVDLIKGAFYIFLASLTRYDGWFQFAMSGAVVFWISIWKWKGIRKIGPSFLANFSKAEGNTILFCTLGGFGIVLWFFWNKLIFNDWWYFAFGPYSARVQQQQIEQAGILITKSNLALSVKTYIFALFYNIGTFTVILSTLGYIYLWFDKTVLAKLKVSSLVLLAPLFFNILALFLGHSVLFIQGINGDTWFNARYGVMLIPFVAISIGFIVDRLKSLRLVLVGFLLFVTFFSFVSFDSVTIDDARVGSSQKNVTEVSGWLSKNTKEREGFILISAASHDAIIFSSGLPMSKFIHEGTGKYWESATTNPAKWARWIIMRTNDEGDSTFKLVNKTPDLAAYNLVEKYPFADIYQLKEEYLSTLNTKPVFGKQK